MFDGAAAADNNAPAVRGREVMSDSEVEFY